MSRKLVFFSLIVLCLTLLVFTWMVRGSLCEIRVQQGNTVMVALLNVALLRGEHGSTAASNVFKIQPSIYAAADYM